MTSNNVNTQEKLFFSETYEYLEIYLPKQRGKSPCTVKNYKESLSQFRRYLLEQRGISMGKFTFMQCSRELIMEFLDFITSNGCTNSTRNQRLSALKSYLAFVAEKDISLQSIALSVSKIKQASMAEPSRTYLSNDAVSAILSQPDVTTLKGIRDCTLMVLLYDCAFRLSELLNLRLSNLELEGDNPHLIVFGKGSKERLVSISDNATDHLKRYLKHFRGMSDNVTDLVFYTVVKGQAGAMSARNVEKLIKQYSDKARESCPEVPERVHPHMFRRTRATHLYQNGVALPLVSRFLGHSDLNTTKIYAIPSLEMMRSTISSVEHPETTSEIPIWDIESEMARKCGLK
jgi:site-specific recombinase XerD